MAQTMVQDGYQYELVAWDGGIPSATRQCWEALIATNPATNLFSYPAWLDVARTTGLLHPWRILSIRHAGQPLLVLPLQRRTFWTVEASTPLGEDFPILSLAGGAEDSVWIALAKWIRTNGQVQLLSLGRQTDRKIVEHCVQTVLANHGYAYARTMSTDVQAILPPSWDEYLAGLGANTRRNLHRAEDRLRRDYPDTHIEIITDAGEGMTPLDAMIMLHHRRWHGQAGSLFDDPQRREYYRQAVTWAMAQGYGVMSVLRVDDRILTVVLAFHIPGQPNACAHCIGRDLTMLPPHYSPGIAAVGHLIRALIARGVRTVDLGTSTTYYKKLLGGNTRERWELFLARSPGAAALYSTLDAGLHHIISLPADLYRRLHNPQNCTIPDEQ